ncbi:zinc-binding dehydrogenase, partial [Gluconobacter oxydans]|uniref:zinc-binding dehydrogenase n=1 Tax=Gluconobacter oxydans TaxID=442 RepID=UPI0039E931FC
PPTRRTRGWGGRGVVLGNISPADVAVSPGLLIGRRLRIQGSGSATLDEVRQSLALISAGIVRPQIDRIMPFPEAARAHEILEARQVDGRIILSGW